mmetsp:Transcript_37573/g.77147  ORF Transcript_37573/g.77147 Transcript_37573/m.77147 type:complete len:366 (+) Transcript_37573:41-1138(+)
MGSHPVPLCWDRDSVETVAEETAPGQPPHPFVPSAGLGGPTDQVKVGHRIGFRTGDARDQARRATRAAGVELENRPRSTLVGLQAGVDAEGAAGGPDSRVVASGLAVDFRQTGVVAGRGGVGVARVARRVHYGVERVRVAPEVLRADLQGAAVLGALARGEDVVRPHRRAPVGEVQTALQTRFGAVERPKEGDAAPLGGRLHVNVLHVGGEVVQGRARSAGPLMGEVDDDVAGRVSARRLSRRPRFEVVVAPAHGRTDLDVAVLSRVDRNVGGVGIRVVRVRAHVGPAELVVVDLFGALGLQEVGVFESRSVAGRVSDRLERRVGAGRQAKQDEGDLRRPERTRRERRRRARARNACMSGGHYES